MKFANDLKKIQGISGITAQPLRIEPNQDISALVAKLAGGQQPMQPQAKAPQEKNQMLGNGGGFTGTPKAAPKPSQGLPRSGEKNIGAFNPGSFLGTRQSKPMQAPNFLGKGSGDFNPLLSFPQQQTPLYTPPLDPWSQIFGGNFSFRK